MQSLINLADLSVLAITGKDAAVFLQGQTTCDVYEVTENKSNIGAFCTPKGKVIAVFLIAKTIDGFWLILPKTILQTVQSHLEHYKLRSKIEITEMKNAPFAKFLNITTIRTPWILPETSEQFIPQMLKLDEIGGVSFTKGCYTGQEIVTRTHYLGEVKRQLTLAMCEPMAVIETNCAIVDEKGEKVGDVLLAQLRSLPRKIKDAVTDEIETTSINKMMVLCVLNVEVTKETLRLENETHDILRIIDACVK